MMDIDDIYSDLDGDIYQTKILTGSCGSKATYHFDVATGVLRIEGSGKMFCYSHGGRITSAPWGEYCFYLTSVIVSEGITCIDEDAFWGCYNLKNVILPNSVTIIHEGAFCWCSGLKKIIFGDCVTCIGEYAFNGCSNLRSINLNNSNVYIKEGAFEGCTNLKSITFGNSDTYIERFAFRNCSNLTNITIPENQRRIEEKTFYGCSSLLSINIPENVTDISSWAFWGCSKLLEIYNLSRLLIHIGSADYGEVGYYAKNIHWSMDEPSIFYKKNNFIFYNDGEDIVLAGYMGEDTSIEIPNFSTRIGSHAFDSCSSITSITIPNSVTSIEGSAFQNCTSLTSITIPNSVTNIGGRAFWGCSSITSITIPHSVTNIGWAAFQGCSSLVAITIPEDMTIISSEIFKGCSSLSNIIIPKSITIIADSAFENCSRLLNIRLPESVTALGKGVFRNCVGLTNVVIPNSVSYIGVHAFDGCFNLTSITIGETVTRIESGAFYGCYSLTSVVIPNSVTNIEEDVFNGCSNLRDINLGNSVKDLKSGVFKNCTHLRSIIIPNSVTNIENGAFENCHRLISVTIPSSVITIGYFAFLGCRKLCEIYNLSHVYITEQNLDLHSYRAMVVHTSMDEQSSVRVVDGFILLEHDSDVILVGYQGNKKNIIIPDSVTIIGQYAFSGCSSIVNVTIPNSVTCIRTYAFSGCYSLTSVTIGNSVVQIEDDAFCYCEKLWEIYNLSQLEIREGGRDYGLVGRYALYIHKAKSWSIYTIIDDFILYDNRISTILVGYQGDKTDIIIPEEVTIIGNRAFYGCDNLINVTIPDSVRAIDDYAFEDCHNLINVKLGNSISYIGACSFSGSSLKHVIIPRSLTEIGGNAFCGCSCLESVIIPNTVTNIEHDAFSGCSLLSNVTIPSSVTHIGHEAFSGCPKLTSLTNLSIVPQDIAEDAFDIPCVVHICPGCKSAYMNADNWNKLNIVDDVPLPPITLQHAVTAFSYAHNSLTCGYDEVHIHISELGWFNLDIAWESYDDFGQHKTIIAKAQADPVLRNLKGIVSYFRFIKPTISKVNCSTLRDNNNKPIVATLIVSDDGRELYAESCVFPKTLIATIEPQVGWIEFMRNPAAGEVLNWAAPNELADGQTLTARVGIEARAKDPDVSLAIVGSEFDVKFLRPLSIISDEIVMTDPNVSDKCYFDVLLKFLDSNGLDPITFAEKTSGDDFARFYGLQSIKMHKGVSVMTDYVKSGVFKAMDSIIESKFEFSMDDVTPIIIGVDGKVHVTVKYIKHTTETICPFKAKIPIVLEYAWGKLRSEIVVSVRPETVG